MLGGAGILCGPRMVLNGPEMDQGCLVEQKWTLVGPMMLSRSVIFTKQRYELGVDARWAKDAGWTRDNG